MPKTKADIIALPHPSLRQESTHVVEKDIQSDDVQQLIQDMCDATLDWEDSREHEFGVALAAVQINTLLRVIVVRSDLDNKDQRDFDVYINPQITRFDGEPELDFEGCLSVTDLYGKVPRYPKVKIKAYDQDGDKIQFIAKGFKARMFQHEIDHTDGLTFVDRIGPNATYFRINAAGEMQPVNQNEHDALVEELNIEPPSQ